MEHRVLILSAAIVAGFALQSRAQDRWDGYYAGISLDAKHTQGSVGGNANHTYTDKTALVGLYAGRNFVSSSGFVWGPEISLAPFDLSGSRTDAANGTSNISGGVLITPKIRAGFATDKALYYATLGYGLSDAGIKPAGATGKDWNRGLAYGVGAEFALGERWSTRVEFSRYDLGGRSYSFGGSSEKTNLKSDVITLGISRKF
ncbi:MAG: outer membrane beta-barrel protein [Paracoccaceae bacterium]